MTLVLKRASASRPSGEWNDDDYDVLAEGIVVGRIMNAAACAGGHVMVVDARVRIPRGPHTDAGYGPTREAAMAAFATSWRRE